MEGIFFLRELKELMKAEEVGMGGDESPSTES